MNHEAHSHHITPFRTLAIIFGALVVLTILTVLTAQVDLGAFNVPLALAIATLKATLVVLFFMALKYDSKVNALILSIGVLFVTVFIVFTLFDTIFRGDTSNVEAVSISDQERIDAGLSPTTPIEHSDGEPAADH